MGFRLVRDAHREQQRRQTYFTATVFGTIVPEGREPRRSRSFVEYAYRHGNVIRKIQMNDFTSVLSAAPQLPKADRLRLIDALWESVPPDAEAPFSEEWAREIERRVAELDAGTAKTVPWSQIRDEALIHRERNSPEPSR